MREKEQAKEAKKTARDMARKKSAETRAASAANNNAPVPNDEFELSQTGTTIPSNVGVAYVPPEHLDDFSDRPTSKTYLVYDSYLFWL